MFCAPQPSPACIFCPVPFTCQGISLLCSFRPLPSSSSCPKLHFPIALLQCNVLHPLYEFSGARRSCQRSLQRRRERRQRYRQQQQEQEQQQRRQQQGDGAAAGGISSSAEELEEAAADERSDWGPESQWQTHSEAAQGSISWQPTAGPAPQVIVLTLPAALAAAGAAPPARAASWPLEAAWQLDNWQHAVQPTQLQHSDHPAAPVAKVPAHTPPPPPPAPLPVGPLPSWDPATERQASLLSAQQSLASLQRPPRQWQQLDHQQRLAPTPLAPPQVQPPLWQQRPGAGQMQVFSLASQPQPQPQPQLLPAESGTAADGQWEALYSVPGQPAGQPVGMPGAVPHIEHLLPGSAQVQQLDGGLQHAQHTPQARTAPPDVLVWQHSAPAAQLEPHLALQQGGPAPPLPPSMCYAPAKQPSLPHCRSCPSLLAGLEVRSCWLCLPCWPYGRTDMLRHDSAVVASAITAEIAS